MAPVRGCKLTLGWSPLWVRPEPYAWDAVCYRCGAIIAGITYGKFRGHHEAGTYEETHVRPDLVVQPTRDRMTGLPCY